MAKISYQDVPPEFDQLIKQNLTPADRFILPRVSIKKLISRRKLLKGITQKSQLVNVSSAWASFTLSQKNAWVSAGLKSGLTGYKHFTKEYILRLKNGLSPITIPSIYHQGNVGKIYIEAPATKIIIRQDHPIYYWIKTKVKGTKSQYQPKLVTEFVNLPFNVYISYKSNLTNINPQYTAKLIINIISNYQGRDIETLKEFNFSLNQDWSEVTFNVNEVFGKFRYYNVKIHLENVRGELYFDNFKLYHSGKNWARDTACNDIHQDFTRAYYQVSKHWIAEYIENGANFESVYLD